VDIAILLFNGMTALDAVGPYGVLVRLPGAAVTFVAEEPGFVTDDAGRLALGAGTAIGDIPQPEVVVVPGGPGQTALMENRSVLSWLEDAHATTRWTTSVCTGSLVLGAAGILDGKRATSHWLALDQLTRHGAVPVPERVVVDGKVMTAAGVSAGIDMALRLAAELAGAKTAEAIQLGLEYDPQPPFGAGSPGTAPPAVVSALRARSRFLLEG
jgi:putative intracellular protease/amidase